MSVGFSSVFKFIILSYISCHVCINAETLNSSILWCRFCNSAVGDTSVIFNTLISPGAIKVEQRYMFNRNITVQYLVNPFRFVFEVITTENATCDFFGPRGSAERSWFPGYSWRVCRCPRCFVQLGWTFDREVTNDVEDINTNKTFHTLILNSLLGLTEDDPGIGMLHYLKYSKPFKSSSSLPPIRLRASDDTTSTKENAVTPLIPTVKNQTNIKSKIGTEAYNMNKGNLVVPTITRDSTTIATHTAQTTSGTVTTLANTQTLVI